tara:strand:- start:150 stop:347 length:198 start_codon:yes stop_codon:yes gene_type:complete
MGRAINMENSLHKLTKKVERLEKAFEGLAATIETMTVTKNVDLHETKPIKKKTVRSKKVVEEAEA